MTYFIRLPLLLAALAAPTSAQAPTALLRSNQPIPGIAGHDFSGVTWLGTNHTGGLVANISGNASGTFRSFLWGSVGGGALGELRRSGPAGALTIDNFVRACAGNGASHAYLGSVAGVGESLLVDETLIETVGNATAPGGASWIRFEEPFLDETGQPWTRGRYSGSPTSRVGLFRGASLTPVLLPDDVVTGLPGNVSLGGGPEAGYDVSPSGGHWLGVVTADNSQRGVVRDGEVLSAGGVPLVTGNLLPPAFQLSPNERYNGFDQVQMTDGDRWAVRGGTPTGFILRDGEMFVRPGQVVDGQVLVDGFRGIAMNRYGGLAWIGRVTGPGGAQQYAVFAERSLLYKVGDDVDVDGDGMVDPGYTITDIIGSAGRLAYTEDGRVYATVRITTPMGGSPFAVIGAGDPIGVPFCSSVTNSSGRGALMQAVGSSALTDNELRVRCVQMPTNTFGYFLGSRTQGFVPGAGGSQGDLCLSGTLGRFNANIVNSGNTGSIELLLDLTALPQPTGTVAAMVGEAWNFQCWFRDANPSVTSNFSDGIEVVLL